MAPKRTRGEEGSSSTPVRAYDRRKFVSVEAADKFDNVLAGRALVPERGLQPSHQDGEMVQAIRENRWETFVAHPNPACTAIVKEFYANALDTPECEVRVRGQVVSYSRATITQYYALPLLERCEFSELEADYDVIIQSLTQPGTEWQRNMRTGHLKSFPGHTLSRYGKIWHAFLCAKLMPCTHFSDVTVERAKLLYAICKGLKIDVGAVIEASIKRSLKGATSGGLPHPSLITELCRAAGVRWGAAEPLSPPTTLLSHQLIERYVVWTGGVSHPRGLGFQVPQTADVPGPSTVSGPEHTQPVPPPTDSFSSPDLVAMLTRMQRRMDREHRRASARQHSINGQLLRLSQRQSQVMTYVSSSQEAWTTYFSGIHPDADMSYFPAVPQLRPFPPNTTDEDLESPNTSDDSDSSDAEDAPPQ